MYRKSGKSIVVKVVNRTFENQIVEEQQEVAKETSNRGHWCTRCVTISQRSSLSPVLWYCDVRSKVFRDRKSGEGGKKETDRKQSEENAHTRLRERERNDQDLSGTK